jgi:glycosyltransferase involved in cell wall biosynthesis
VVTVITAAYICEKYIAACIRSVAGQSHPATKHIVVDEASSDGTPDIVAALASEHPALQLLRLDDNGGYPAALNHALSLVETPFVAVLDGDDVALPN